MIISNMCYSQQADKFDSIYVINQEDIKCIYIEENEIKILVNTLAIEKMNKVKFSNYGYLKFYFYENKIPIFSSLMAMKPEFIYIYEVFDSIIFNGKINIQYSHLNENNKERQLFLSKLIFSAVISGRVCLQTQTPKK